MNNYRSLIWQVYLTLSLITPAIAMQMATVSEVTPKTTDAQRLSAEQAEKSCLLIQAIEENTPDKIVQLIKEGASVGTTTAHLRTPLAFAAAFGYNNLVIELLKKGAAVNQCEGLALRDALLHGHTDIGLLLLQHGAKPAICAPHWLVELKNKFLYSALHVHDNDLTALIEYGVLDWVNQALRMLPQSNLPKPLERAKKLLAYGTTNGKLLVKQAIENKDLHQLQLLLTQCPSCVPEEFSHTTVEMDELLLQHGSRYVLSAADVGHHRWLIDFFTLTAKYGFEIAHFESELTGLKALVRDGSVARNGAVAKKILILCTVLAKDAMSLQRLSTEIAQPDSSANLATALAVASAHKRIDAIDLLLENNADPEEAIEVVTNILKRKNLEDRRTYETILRHFKYRSKNPRTCPSLRSLIIHNKNSNVKKQLIAHSTQLPDELEEQLPAKEYAAELIKYHSTPCNALLSAYKCKRLALLPYLIPAVFKQFADVCDALKEQNITTDTILNTCGINPDLAVLTPKLLQLLLSFALQRRPLLLNDLLLDPKYQNMFLEHLRRLLHYHPWPSLPYENIRGNSQERARQVCEHAKNKPHMFLSAVDHGQLHLAEVCLSNESACPLLHKALMLAIQKGHTHFATALLDSIIETKKSEFASQKNEEQLTALDYAVIYNRVTTLMQLCTFVSRMDPEQVDAILTSALMHACQHGRKQCIKVILANFKEIYKRY